MSYCLFISLHRELVKELTMQVQNNNRTAVRTIAIVGKAGAQIQSFPVFFRQFIRAPTTTRARLVEDRLKAIQEVNMVLCLLRLCVFYYCVQILQPIAYSYQTFRKYARVLTSDSGELPKLSTKSNCVVCWSFR